jgi:hypothetical protein
MYVANSEPTIWQRGGGGAGVRERGLISGGPNRSEVGRDMGRWYVLPVLSTSGVSGNTC